MSHRLGFAAVALAFYVTMIGTTLPTPLYPLYQAEYGFSQLLTTVIFATYALGVLAALLALGRLSDALGRKPLLFPGLAFAALSAGCFLLADGLPLLLLGRLLQGLSAGIFTGTATAALLDLAPGARLGRGRATLLATGVNMLGLGSGPLLAGVLVETAGAPLRTCFWVELGLVVVAAAVLARAPETVARRSAAEIAKARELRLPGVAPEARPAFFRGAIAGFAGFAVLGLFTAVAPAFLGSVLDERSAAVTGAIVLSTFVASAAGQSAVERVGLERSLAAGCAILLAGMVVLATSLEAESLPLLVAAALVAGLGQGLSFRAALGGITGAAPPEQRGEVASAFFVVSYVAISLPVIGVGLLAHATDLKTAGLVFSVVVAVLAAIVLTALARDRQSTDHRSATL